MGPEDVPSSPPRGFRLFAGNPPLSMQAQAVAILRREDPLGTISYFAADGQDYAARIEPHPPDPPRGLNDWHRGVTIYEAIPGYPSLAPLVFCVLGLGLLYAITKG